MPKQPVWFIPGQAITDAREDAFAHDDIAEQLVAIIDAVDPPATIGLTGGFGTGKSSIINLLGRKLSGSRHRQLVTLSAEKHSGVARQRALVYSFAQALRDDAQVEPQKITRLLERVEQDVVREGADLDSLPFTRWMAEHRGRLLRPALTALGITVSLYFMAVAVLALLNAVNVTDVNALRAPALFVAPVLIAIAGALGLGQLLPEWVKAGLTPDTVRRSRPRIEAADEFERLFGALADLTDKQLIVVVDDLDRLSPNEVLEALASVRTFQSIPNKDVLFILTCDEVTIRDALTSARPGLSRVEGDLVKAAEEYLHKLFVVRQALPPHLHQDMRGYADDLLARVNHAGAIRLGSDNVRRVLDILVHDGVRSPRHVIRLLNGFFADYRLADVRETSGRLQQGEVTDHATLLARLTVLKVDFYPFFHSVVSEFALLDATDTYLLTGDVDAEQQAILASAFGWTDQTDDPRAVPEHLADFLRRTVHHVDRRRPLTSFIYLGQTEADRILGSERADRVRRALENGNPDELRERFAEAGEVASAAVDAAMHTLTQARPGLPKSNAAAAIAAALPDAPEDERQRLAEELAVVIEEDPTVAPAPDPLANVIRSCSPEHQSALVRLLAENPKDDSTDTRTRRARVQLIVAAEGIEVQPLRDALALYFSGLPDEGDAALAGTWVTAVSALSNEALHAVVDAPFYTAIARLVVGLSPGGSDDWRDDAASLYARAGDNARVAEVFAALVDALRAGGVEPRRVALAILARLGVTARGLPDILRATAAVVTDEEVEASPEDAATATRLLGEWSERHASDLRIDDETTRDALLGAISASAPDQPVVAAEALASVTAVWASGAAAVLQRLLPVVTERGAPGDPVATPVRDALLDTVPHVDAEDAASVVAGMLAAVSTDHGPSAPAAQFALESLDLIIARDLQDRLAPLIPTWQTSLNSAVADPVGYLTPIEAIARAARAGVVSEDVATAVLNRLRTLHQSGGNAASTMVLALALVPWPENLRAAATEVLAGAFDDLDAPSQAYVVAHVAAWGSLRSEHVDDDLQKALLNWLVDGQRDDAERAHALALRTGFTPTRQSILIARLIPHLPALRTVLNELQDETLPTVLMEAVRADTFQDVARAVASDPRNNAALLAFAAGSVDAAKARWNTDAVRHAVAHVDADAAAELVQPAMAALDDGEEKAIRGAAILDALAGREPPVRPETETMTEVATRLMATASPELASLLGSATRWLPDASFKETLRELRRSKEQESRAAADAFESGRRDR